MSRKSRIRKKRNSLNNNHHALDLIENAESPKTKNGLSNQIATRQNSIDFYGSIIGALPNPDPVLKKMGKTIEVYDNISFDSRVQAVVSSRKSAVKSMEWGLTGENVPDSEKEFHKEYLNEFNMHDVLDEILDAALYGYKPIEIIWGSDGTKTIPNKLVGLPQKWFEYNYNNELVFLSKSNNYTGIKVPENKFIVSRSHPTYANPYGIGAYSACFWPVTFRKNGLKFWTVFLEKYGIPFLVGKSPEGEQENRIFEIADMLESMVQDAIAVVPKDYDIEIKESAQSAGKNDSIHKTYLDFMNLEIAMAIIGTNLTTEVQGGSFAASQSHMEVRKDIIESDQRIVEQTFNELIKTTHSFNFNSKIPPKFNLFSEEKVETTRSERDRNIQGADKRFRFTEIYYKKHYNLSDEDFTLEETNNADAARND